MSNKDLTKAGLFCALIALSTMVIKLPIPQTQGYVNLGDSVIFLSSLFLVHPYCALAAALGSVLADIFLGAGIYILPTFIIKGIMGIIAAKTIAKESSAKKTAILIALTEIFMIFGYFGFEIFVYGLPAACASLPFNVMQGIAGTVIGFLLIQFVKKTGLQDKF